MVNSSRPVGAGASTVSDTTATGVNYHKAGEDPPLKEDSAYPEWLWSIVEPPPSLFTLERKYPKEELINDDNFEEVGLVRSLQNQHTRGLEL